MKKKKLPLEKHWFLTIKDYWLLIPEDANPKNTEGLVPELDIKNLIVKFHWD
jgi:hypothetical protein